VDINAWENIVGSGPFKITAARRGDAVTLARNPTYFKPGRPYVDGLTILGISDAGTAAAAVKAGRIQMTTGLTSLGIDDLLKLEKELKGKYSLYWQSNVTDLWYVFGNAEKAPWNDPRILKALRLATDQEELQKGWAPGTGTSGRLPDWLMVWQHARGTPHAAWLQKTKDRILPTPKPS